MRIGACVFRHDPRVGHRLEPVLEREVRAQDAGLHAGQARVLVLGHPLHPMLIVFPLALIAGSTQLSTVAEFMASPEAGLRVTIGLALVAFVMVAIAENARIPVDNPATHLELTMVHEAMVLEYSGRHLALIELAAAIKLLLYASLLACLFVPWGLATPGAGIQAMGVGFASYAAKLTAAGVLLAAGETAVAKMRVFRVSEFLGAALMLGLLGTLLLFLTRSL